MTRYRIVPERSRLTIAGRSSVHGIRLTADGVEGWLDLLLEDAGIDLSTATGGQLSVPVGRFRSGNSLEDRELRRRVDARRFPSVDATLTNLAPTGSAGRHHAAGDITFHGVTRAHEGEVSLTALDDDRVRVEGRTTVDVRPFGVEPPRLLGLRVEPEVEVTLEVVATAAG
jgi:polyisoprenoid-binding protein YceI